MIVIDGTGMTEPQKNPDELAQSSHELRRWARLMNERRHATVFAQETIEDRMIVELSTLREFCTSVHTKYGLVLERIANGPAPNKSPDCYAELLGARISLELTELTEILGQIREAEKHDISASAYHGEVFQKSQWSKDRLQNSLSGILDKKSDKYRNTVDIDILIIHTDEPWLDPRCVEEWLSVSKFAAREAIRSAYLLMTPFPGYSNNWPVFRLY
jgi:hypothetical protein